MGVTKKQLVENYTCKFPGKRRGSSTGAGHWLQTVLMSGYVWRVVRVVHVDESHPILDMFFIYNIIGLGSCLSKWRVNSIYMVVLVVSCFWAGHRQHSRNICWMLNTWLSLCGMSPPAGNFETTPEVFECFCSFFWLIQVAIQITRSSMELGEPTNRGAWGW